MTIEDIKTICSNFGLISHNEDQFWTLDFIIVCEIKDGNLMVNHFEIGKLSYCGPLSEYSKECFLSDISDFVKSYKSWQILHRQKQMEKDFVE